MNIAILGGSFDPVHIGHLFVAEEVRTHMGYDRILFIPANVPVHKDHDLAEGPGHRLRMLRLAVAGHPGFRVDARELKRGGDSYTIDTVREILDLYQGIAKPGLIIGDDLADTFDSWKEARDLANRVDLIIAHRLSTVRDADRIVVLDGGRIVEQGPHDALMARSGVYRRLVEHQIIETSAA